MFLEIGVPVSRATRTHACECQEEGGEVEEDAKEKEALLEEARESAAARRIVMCDDNYFTLLPGDSRVVR